MKSLVLKEMKRILLNLSDVDKIVCQELKMEAFDNIKSISMLSQEVLSLEEKLKCERRQPLRGQRCITNSITPTPILSPPRPMAPRVLCSTRII